MHLKRLVVVWMVRLGVWSTTLFTHFWLFKISNTNPGPLLATMLWVGVVAHLHVLSMLLAPDYWIFPAHRESSSQAHSPQKEESLEISKPQDRQRDS